MLAASIPGCEGLRTRRLTNTLSDPVLELHDANGSLLSTNDNWRSDQQSDLIAIGLAPTDNREPAILATLVPGSYTAILRGKGTSAGKALFQVYQLL
jgi:hypothetical protein